MATLVIRSRLDGRDQQWFVKGAGESHRPVAPGSLAGGKGLSRKRDVIWLVAGQDLTLLTKVIPSKRASDLQRAVPYAVEEELAVPTIDGCKFAIGPRLSKDDEVTVAVANGAELQIGFEHFSEAGLRPSQAVPDVLALDWQEGSWSVLVDGDSALVRTAFLRGYAVESENLAWALQQSLASTVKTERPDRIRLWGDARLPSDFGIPVEQVPGESAAAFALGLEKLPQINLLGLAELANPLGRTERRYLQVAAALLAAVLLTMLGSAFLQLQQLERYKGELERAVVELFRDAVPEAQRIVNPRAQLDQKLERLRSQQAGRGEMLPQLAELATRLGAEKNFALKSLTFQEDTFLLKFNTGSVQRLDAIKSGIERDTPYRVTIESVDKQKDFVSGTIRVRENDAS